MNGKTEKIAPSKYSEWIYVKESNIHNKGVFAFKDIPKGTKIIEYIGEKITKEAAEERLDRDEKNGTVYVFELDENYDIDGFVGGSDAIYINHTCNPNSEVDIIDGKIWIIATKDIKKDEELSYDYGFDLDEDTLNHKCRCGHTNCIGYLVNSDKKEELEIMLQKNKQ